MLLRNLLIIALCFVVCGCEVVKLLKPCGKTKSYGNGQLNEVRITPCPEAAKNKPCVLKKNTNVSIEIDLTPNLKKKVVSFTSKAFWANKVVDMPLPNMNSTGCAFTQCPLENGKAVTYTYMLNIAKSFPDFLDDSPLHAHTKHSISHERISILRGTRSCVFENLVRRYDPPCVGNYKESTFRVDDSLSEDKCKASNTDVANGLG